VVVVRAARNNRLVDACYLWAFAALTASAGARRCYDAHRAALLFLLALDTPVSPDGVDNRCGKGGQADGCSPADDATPS
jgi:hypothetical protein